MSPLTERQPRPNLEIPDEANFALIVEAHDSGIDFGARVEARKHNADFTYLSREQQPLKPLSYTSLDRNTVLTWDQLLAEFRDNKRALVVAGRILRKAQTEQLSPVDIEALRKIRVLLECYGYTEAVFFCKLGWQMVVQFKDIISRYEKNEPQIIYPVVLSPEDQAKKNAQELDAFTRQARATVAAQENMRFAQMFTQPVSDSEIFKSPAIIYTSIDRNMQLTAQELIFKFGDLFNDEDLRVVTKIILFKARQENRALTLEEVEQLRMIIAYHKTLGFSERAMEFLFNRQEITEIRKAIEHAEAAYAPKTK